MEPPQTIATRWHEDLFAGDMHSVWEQMTPNFRRVVVRHLLDYDRLQGRDPDVIVEELATGDPHRDDVSEVIALARGPLVRSCGIEPVRVAPGETVRFEAPLYEVVRLYRVDDLERDERGTQVLYADQTAMALTIILESDPGGARSVAGVGAVLNPDAEISVYWEPPRLV